MAQRRWFSSTAATASLITALVTGAVTGARASTHHGTSGAAAAPTCHYTVRYDGSAVRENPDTDSVVRKYKQVGDGVTARWPCEIVVDTESGAAFAEVVCACASDDRGWMRKDQLRAS
jgi:hypothetical protein